jgi:hypothetical protein
MDDGGLLYWDISFFEEHRGGHKITKKQLMNSLASLKSHPQIECKMSVYI